MCLLRSREDGFIFLQSLTQILLHSRFSIDVLKNLFFFKWLLLLHLTIFPLVCKTHAIFREELKVFYLFKLSSSCGLLKRWQDGGVQKGFKALTVVCIKCYIFLRSMSSLSTTSHSSAPLQKHPCLFCTSWASLFGNLGGNSVQEDFEESLLLL